MRRHSRQLVPTILVLLVSISVAVVVTWLVPSLSAASVNMLFRLRGEVSPPGDIIVVAIDDASLQQVGNWPWPRFVMASVLDHLTAAHPKAVGLDVIYAEASAPEDDKLLAAAIARNGHVVLPAQLTEGETVEPTSQSASAWLLPLDEIGKAAAATGHAHAAPDVDGVLRTIQLSKADEKGTRLWAFGLETLRVAEAIPPAEIEERAGSLRVGRYEIGIHDEADKSSIPGVQIIRPNEMLINYLGPPKTFPYYSISDVLHGKLPPETFAGKIVLIGAVAQTMGDTRITPFISYGSLEHRSGIGMPGVEVHANVIETIRRGAGLRARPDWLGFLVAALVIICAASIVRLLDGWRAILSLCALFILIIAGSLYVFNRHFIVPPLVPMLSGFFTVVPLLLLNASIAASRDLDQKLDRLTRIQKRFGLVPELRSGGQAQTPELQAASLPSGLPRNITWKLSAVDEITAHLIARIGFMNEVFTSMTDGLLVTDMTARVVFANPAALRFWDGAANDSLAGRRLEELFVERGVIGPGDLRETLREAAGGQHVLMDVEWPGREARFYTLQFSAVARGSAPAVEEPQTDVGPPSSQAIEERQAIGIIVIITDVTKRRELERVKAETLQLVSHELRTPLTSIQGLSDLLLKYPVPEGESQEILGTIHSEAVRLNELINRYLDVKRIESGAQSLTRKPVPVNGLVEGCVRLLAGPAADKRIRIELKLEEPSPIISGDAQLLSQVFNNLLSNAIKYSPPGSPVWVGSVKNDGRVQVYVRDEGYGIPAQFQARVFEKFYRLERDEKSETVGTGLGLSLVKEIVERHGGQVTLESEPDKGSTFTVHFPAEKS